MSESEISLRWYSPPPEDVVNTGPIFFEIDRKEGAGSWVSNYATVKNERFFIDTGLTADAEYSYKIRAWRYNKDDLQSADSSTVAATPTAEYGNVDFPGTAAAEPAAEPLLWLVGENTPPGIRGTVGTWLDRTDYRHHARARGNSGSTILTSQPEPVDWVVGEQPFVRFDGNDFLRLPPTMFDTAGPWAGDSLELFAVLRSTGSGTQNGPWKLGAHGSTIKTFYPNSDGGITDSFFSDTDHVGGQPAPSLSDYHLYNVWADAGHWESRINGRIHHVSRDNTIHSSSDMMGLPPLIGTGYGPDITDPAFGFEGDIAALLIFDKALSVEQRYVVGSQLNHVYGLVEDAPSTPDTLVPLPLGTTQMALSWLSPDASDEEWRLGGVLYDVQHKLTSGGGTTTTTFEQARDCLITGLTIDTSYDFRVRARNLAGHSAWTGWETETTGSSGTDYPVAKELAYFSADYAPTWKMGSWPSRRGSSSEHGLQSLAAYQPILKENALYHKPAVMFGDTETGTGYYFGLGDLLDTVTDAEVFAVVRVESESQAATERALWLMGGDGTVYPSQTSPRKISEGFGRPAMGAMDVDDTEPPDLSHYRIYNVSAGSSNWSAHIDGDPYETDTASYTITFPSGNPGPLLGASAMPTDYFVGEIVSAVFFDSALNTAERGTVYEYMKLVNGLDDNGSNGLPDYWEIEYFGDLDETASGDYDEDNLNNYTELLLGTDPTNKDTDGDELNDDSELAEGTNPLSPDTDGDGMSDGWEVAVNNALSSTFLDPLDPSDASLDPDSDGLTTLEEWVYFDLFVRSAPYNGDIDDGEFSTASTPSGIFLNPANPDCNEDGLLDGISLWVGIDPLDDDVDDDTLSNAYEVEHGLDPLNEDTDADTCDDATDDYPLDPERGCGSEPPTVGGDPSVSLSWPLNRVPLP